MLLCELLQELGKRCLLHLNCFFPFFLLSALDKQNELHFVGFIPASESLHFYMKKYMPRRPQYKPVEARNYFSSSVLL